MKESDAWLRSAAKEIEESALSKDLSTIYIGGGTPTCLSSRQLESLCTLLDPYASYVREYTVEINPETLDKEKAEILARHGINRASVGVQTGHVGLLALLGRHHNNEDVHTCMSLLKEAGIDNISLDLMYGLPGETLSMLEEDLDTVMSFAPKHISLYSLEVHEGTVFSKKGITECDPDLEADMYEMICDRLPKEGYHQYEISNFAREGYESMHNRVYWHYDNFYGISAGASGKDGLIRYSHDGQLSSYLKDPLCVEKVELSREDAMFEMVMMGLRLKEGMSLSLFEERFGVSFFARFKGKVEPLIKEGLLEIQGDTLRCTKRGFALENTVLVELM